MDKIRIEKIKKAYVDMEAVEELSLTVADNQFVSIVGPSGCGKSTLLNLISGLEKPDSGEILINGKNSIGKTGLVSYMHQKDLLLPWKNVLYNVCIPLMLKGSSFKEAKSKASNYMEDFGLKGFEEAYPAQLSGGMRQRAALLRTYLFTSDIMLLDEPFGSLDAITRRKMQLWLLQIFNNYKPAILFVTHDIDEAIFLSDKVYVLTERPAKIKKEFNINLSRPRGTKTYANTSYIKAKEEILELLS